MTVRIQSITTHGTLHGHVPNTFPMGLLASSGWFNSGPLNTLTLKNMILRSNAPTVMSLTSNAPRSIRLKSNAPTAMSLVIGED